MKLLFSLFLFIVCTLSAAPCVFPLLSTNIPYVATTFAQVQTCFESVPLNSAIKTETLATMNQLIQLYSFTEISLNSPPPYNLQVDLKGGLQTIQQTTQASDWDFHYQISTLFQQLGDAHTLYFPPTPYENFFQIFPFILNSGVDGYGNQIVFVSSATTIFGIPYASYVNINGVNLASYVGQTLISINGEPIISWLLAKGKRQGTVKDPSVQFNNALINSFVAQIHEINFANQSAMDTYLFSSGSVSIPSFMFGFQAYTGLTNFMTNITAPATKKRQITDKPSIPPYRFSSMDIIRKQQRFREMIFGNLFEPSKYKPQDFEGMGREQIEEELAMNEPIQTDLHYLYNDHEIQKKRQTVTTIISSNSSSAVCSSFVSSTGIQSMILQLTTFEPPAAYLNSNSAFFGWSQSFINTIGTCIDYAQNAGITNLIIDVRSNGGGVICLSNAATAQLWSSDLDPAKTGKLFQPFDMRRNGQMDILTEFTDFSGDYFQGPTTGIPQLFGNNDMSWYTTLKQYNRGGILGNYTEQWGFPGACINVDNDYGIKIKTYLFTNTFILTDGLCGSACSQFLSIARYLGKAAIISVGGVIGQPMESSSFTGGNVEDWTSLIPQFQMGATGTSFANFFQLLPTTAFTRFNHREMYLGNSNVPREFLRIQPDVQLQIWLSQSTSSTLSLFQSITNEFGNVGTLSSVSGVSAPSNGNGGSSLSTSPSSSISSTFSKSDSISIHSGFLLSFLFLILLVVL